MSEIKRKKSNISPLCHLIYISVFTLFTVFSALLQCSGVVLFGIVPNVTFALICAIGFIAGEKYGGIFGLLGGVLVSSLGSSGISLTPILFTFCGYLCGALPRVILRRNFLSYLVYMPIMGAMHIIFTLVYYIMFSQSYDIWSVFGKLIIPEFLSCIICMMTAYGAVRLTYKLFKGKKKDSRAK